MKRRRKWCGELFAWVGQERVTLKEAVQQTAGCIFSHQKVKEIGIQVPICDLEESCIQRAGGAW